MRQCSILILFLLLCVCNHALAQTGVKGMIRTGKGEPLPFAAIVVKGTQISTISNEEGKYQLDLKPGFYEVIFQYLGFKTGQKSFTIEHKMENYDLTMEEQAYNLGEVRIGNKGEDPAYTIMRRAIAKSRYHFLQVESYTAKAYSKSSFVITDLPLEFLYKKELKEIEKESNFKKGVPILNESVSEVTFRQPNSYKQRVIAARNSQDNNFASANQYFLTSFYQPEVVKAVSPLSPRAFAYYKFEYQGSFRENGVEINKIKVTPRSYGEGVYKGTIYITENLWSIYSLNLQTVNTGFNIEIRQVYSPVQGVWMPTNQQFHVNGGIYGIKGKGDLVISQTFSKLKVNPAFQADIAVVDGKREKEEAKKIGLTNREIKTRNLEEVVSKQKEFSAKNLKKLMKEYEKQELKAKEEKGEDVDLNFSRNDSTSVDSMANRRSMAFWDSIRSVPLTVAEVKSYTRLDSIIIVKEGTREQQDSLKVANSDTTKKKGGGGSGAFGDLFTGHTFRLGKKSPWSLEYVSPLWGLQVNTVEGWVLNGGGFKLRYKKGAQPRKNTDEIVISDKGVSRTTIRQEGTWTFSGLTRYSFAREKLLATGGAEYAWKRNIINFSGGKTVSQFNPDNPMNPVLNSLTTLFLERNFIKIYEKNFVRLDFKTNQSNEHFELKANLEYADRRALQNRENTDPYNWIDWKKRSFTSNIPWNAESFSDEPGTGFFEMVPHQALVLGLSASYKPWQKYRTRKGKTTFYDDDSPKLSAAYRKGIKDAFGSDVDFDFVQVGISHGFDIGIRSKLSYKVAAGAFLNDNAVQFPDYQHFAGNRFFFQYGDPVGTFRMLDYYRYSTSKRFVEAHALAELRKFLLTQITWFRVMGIKENFFAHYLATPDSSNYGELGYALDVGIRFPFRIEVANSFEGFKYKHTVFRIGTTMNFSLGKK
jgi:hypothetical protein